MPDGVHRVAQSPRDEHDQGTASVAEAAVHRREKNASREGVAEHVKHVGVERERRDGAPDFAGQNAFARSRALREPDGARSRRTGDGVENDEERHHQRRRERARVGQELALALRRPILVFRFVEVNGLDGALAIAAGDQDHPPRRSVADDVRDAHRGQDERPLANLARLVDGADDAGADLTVRGGGRKRHCVTISTPSAKTSVSSVRSSGRATLFAGATGMQRIFREALVYWLSFALVVLGSSAAAFWLLRTSYAGVSDDAVVKAVVAAHGDYLRSVGSAAAKVLAAEIAALAGATFGLVALGRSGGRKWSERAASALPRCVAIACLAHFAWLGDEARRHPGLFLPMLSTSRLFSIGLTFARVLWPLLIAGSIAGWVRLAFAAKRAIGVRAFGI